MSGFIKADSRNLPKIDAMMLMEYIANSNNHNIAEIRGAKSLMSSRDSYLETAVGYVEIMREHSRCTVRAKICPEHKISTKLYEVTAHICEQTATILDASCGGCAASAGGCKHSLLLLNWLLKKSESPSSTSVECYWIKPSLTTASKRPLECCSLGSKVLKLAPKTPVVLTNFLLECDKRNISNSLITTFTEQKELVNIFDLAIDFVDCQTDLTFENFKIYIDNKITSNIKTNINNKTLNQVNSKLWHSVRQGRITASKIYELASCTTDGALVQQILGGYKVPETLEIKRGKTLENAVIKEVEILLKKKISPSGFLLIDGLIGASPDGVGDDFIVEVKCPSTQNTFKNYINNNKITNKFVAQMQIQMLAADKKRGLFCVADSCFEQNKKITMLWIDYEPVFASNIIKKAIDVWRKFVYQKIIESAQS